MYLSLSNPRKKVSVTAVCEAFAVSNNHLLKVVAHLSQSDFINTTRGKNGGISLAWLPEQISLGDVIRSTKGPLQSIDCFKPFCPVVRSCRLPGIFGEATEAWLKVLDDYTIRDLITPAKGLREALNL